MVLSVLKLCIFKEGDCDRLFSKIGAKKGYRPISKYGVNLCQDSVACFTESSSFPSIF
jgi:hypothetical protein